MHLGRGLWVSHIRSSLCCGLGLDALGSSETMTAPTGTVVLVGGERGPVHLPVSMWWQVERVVRSVSARSSENGSRRGSPVVLPLAA